MITNDDPAERHGPLKSLKIFTKQKNLTVKTRPDTSV